MKYCISARQDKDLIFKADEIKVFWKDRNIIYDFIEDQYRGDIILEVPAAIDLEPEWSTLKLFNEEIENFYLCLQDLDMCKKCKENDLKFYWSYPVQSYYDLRGLEKIGAAQVLLSPPLFFDLEEIHRNFSLDIRLVANKAYDRYLPRENGIHGGWIRPEDIVVYEPYVKTIEFWAENLTIEKTLFHIYKENGFWPGNLNLLIKDLNYNVDNRAFPLEFAKNRINCKQKCQSNGNCHLCDNIFLFLNHLQDLHNEKKEDN